MATLTINTKRILDNIVKLNNYLSKQGLKWTLVTKVLNGHNPTLEKILWNDAIKNVHSVGDARISNLKIIKEIRPDTVTLYLKPPALNQVKNVVKYADISLNSSDRALEALDKEAGLQGKQHRAIIMIEMGELREGVMRENLLKFYEKAFSYKNVKIIGIGTNLGCMYGVEPTYDKLIQLSLYKQLIDEKFDKSLDLVSGGSSITLPLLQMKKVPSGVNHFRVGETAFMGVSPLDGKQFRKLTTNVFDFSGDILEFEKKGVVPDGVIGNAAIGVTAEFDEAQKHKETYRCILDFGEIDVDVSNLTIKDSKIKFVGTTSDMTVFDLGDESEKYQVGDSLHFRPNYMAVARLMNSRYMTKKII